MSSLEQSLARLYWSALGTCAFSLDYRATIDGTLQLLPCAIFTSKHKYHPPPQRQNKKHGTKIPTKQNPKMSWEKIPNTNKTKSKRKQLPSAVAVSNANVYRCIIVVDSANVTVRAPPHQTLPRVVNCCSTQRWMATNNLTDNIFVGRHRGGVGCAPSTSSEQRASVCCTESTTLSSYMCECLYK